MLRTIDVMGGAKLIMIDGEGPLGAEDAKRAAAVENHKKWVEAAAYLGCHAIRVNAQTSGGPSEDELAKQTADGLRQLAEFADPFGGDGDRVAVALSGGKDSLTLLEVLLRLEKRAPVRFSVCAFTIEQGTFLRPIEPLGGWLRSRGVDWSYFHDKPSFRLLDEQPAQPYCVNSRCPLSASVTWTLPVCSHCS